jgi:isochorismate synthase
MRINCNMVRALRSPKKGQRLLAAVEQKGANMRSRVSNAEPIIDGTAGLALAPQFLLSNPERTLLLEPGAPREDLVCASADLGPALSELSRSLPERHRAGVRFVGAIPFDPAESALLSASRLVRSVGSWPFEPSNDGNDQTSDRAPQTDFPRSMAKFDRPSPYETLVADALRRIEVGDFTKVVLARTVDLPNREVDMRRLLSRLRADNPLGNVFCVRLPETVAGEPRLMVGVTPELLVSKRGLAVVSSPLAGTAARSQDRELDQSRRLALLGSAKDRHEHALVVQRIASELRPIASEVYHDPEPHVVGTKSLWHLRTHIRATLKNASVTSLDVALRLHPTPAVCGEPFDPALAFIRQHESTGRGFFAGALGHMDYSGDGDWFVTIRCAEVTPQRARLYAGAGIVSGSVPALEFAETAAKMETMRSLFGGGEHER